MNFLLHPRVQSIIDSSLTALLLTAAGAVATGMFLMMLCTSCSDNSKKKDPKGIAENALSLLADRPETVKVIAWSEMDSVFGRTFFTDKEMTQILNNLNSFTQANMKNLGDIENPKTMADYKRISSLTYVIENNVFETPSSNEFTGWRLKAIYESEDFNNEKTKSERYFIFDKDMNSILHTFEIPIL